MRALPVQPAAATCPLRALRRAKPHPPPPAARRPRAVPGRGAGAWRRALGHGVGGVCRRKRRLKVNHCRALARRPRGPHPERGAPVGAPALPRRGRPQRKHGVVERGGGEDGGAEVERGHERRDAVEVEEGHARQRDQRGAECLEQHKQADDGGAVVQGADGAQQVEDE
ncbi:MAG: hypothetical protein J3K34DRAFT_406030 [Monoraphidium minutum]|nr:MAG: hypothetical protein J3K34DRAFT_406030 [Monoraphidium minutum]